MTIKGSDTMSSGRVPPGDNAGSSGLLPVCDPQGLAPLLEVLTEDQVLEIARLCLVDAMEKTNLVAHAADTENWTDVAMYAHDVKSSAGQLGALRLQDLALRLEDNCRNDGGRKGPELVAAFKDAAQLTQACYDADQIHDIMALAKA